MRRFIHFTSVILLAFSRPISAETERFEPRYVAAADVLEMWVRSNGGVPKDEEIEAVVKKGEAVISGTTVKIDERLNSVEIDGKAEAVEGMRALVKEVDFRPDVVQLKCVLMEVRLDAELKHALDLYGGNAVVGTAIFEGDEADLDALVKKAGDSKRATIRSRPGVYTTGNQEATISWGTVGGDLFTLNLTPLVNSGEEVTLSMEATRTNGDKTSQMNTTVRVGDGDVVIIGGMVDRDAEGKRTETLLLLQPTVVPGEKAEQ